MKRAISTLLAINLFISLLFSSNLAYASNKEIVNDENYTTKGYWSKSNAPEFYGTTKIVLKKGRALKNLMFFKCGYPQSKK